MTSEEEQEVLNGLRELLMLDFQNLIKRGLPIGLTFNTLRQASACRTCNGTGCPTCYDTGFNVTLPSQ